MCVNVCSAKVVNLYASWRPSRWTTHSRDHFGKGTATAEDAQWTPTQSHISPSILVYEENHSFMLQGDLHEEVEGHPYTLHPRV